MAGTIVPVQTIKGYGVMELWPAISETCHQMEADSHSFFCRFSPGKNSSCPLNKRLGRSESLT